VSAGTRVPLAEATLHAQQLVGMLAPACLSITVAGSIRRRKPDVGDIDLVCVPILVDDIDMFGEATGEPYNALSALCDSYAADGVLRKRLDVNGRPSWGESLKRAEYAGLAVDIQSVTDPDTLGAWLLIRTGPASFNKALVTERRQGGLLPSGFKFRDGFKLYRWDERVPTPDERSVFDALGISYLEPWERGL
jgi:DNA polymerase/3'-5' exonuclease PolX